jgi:hypothetical protein
MPPGFPGAESGIAFYSGALCNAVTGRNLGTRDNSVACPSDHRRFAGKRTPQRCQAMRPNSQDPGGGQRIASGGSGGNANPS